ncbi:MAG: type II secretion system protein GspN [Deltaproteobacteria bacterium]|nr:type II secretion system protein GspN [Deltaproteobacteria bacterium]
MANDSSLLTAPLPRPMLYVGVPLAGLLLTSFFIFMGFPYHELGERLSHELEQSTGVQITFVDFGPHLGLLGPGLSAAGVDARLSDGQELHIDRLVLRAGWSLQWLRMRPVIHIDLESPLGAIQGNAILGSARGWDGTLREVQIAKIPFATASTGLEIEGTVDADVDLLVGESGADGTLRFEIREGFVAHEQLPVGIPYKTMRGELQLGGEQLAVVESFEIDSPVVSGKITGNIGRAEQTGESPLELKGELVVRDQATRGLFQRMGIRFDAEGKASVEIGGKLSQPRFL